MKIPNDLWNWAIHLIKENRPVWLANGVEIGPADRIDISATVTRSGNTISISGMSTAAPHGIVSASHTATGLTAGHVLTAATATTFEFAAITDDMIPSTIARDTEIAAAVGTHEEAGNPHPQYATGDLPFVPLALFTTAGDLVVATAPGIVTRKGIGANDTVATADDTQTGGFKWAKPKFVSHLVFGTEEQTFTV